MSGATFDRKFSSFFDSGLILIKEMAKHNVAIFKKKKNTCMPFRPKYYCSLDKILESWILIPIYTVFSNNLFICLLSWIKIV